jgi:hypothetical protein
MRKSLSSPKLSPMDFEPELVSTLKSVLDAAVDQIDVANRTPATKAKMAERILRAASDGRAGLKNLNRTISGVSA